MGCVLYVKETTGTVASVSARLAEAARESGIEVVAEHDVRERLGAAGEGLARDCRVLEMWNPKRTKRALDADMFVSTILPCRIAVFEADRGIQIGLVKPTALLDLWGRWDNPDLERIAQDAEDALICIIEAACR